MSDTLSISCLMYLSKYSLSKKVVAMAPHPYTEELMMRILEMRRHGLVSTDLIVVEKSRSDNTLLCNTTLELKGHMQSSTRKRGIEETMTLYKASRQDI